MAVKAAFDTTRESLEAFEKSSTALTNLN